MTSDFLILVRLTIAEMDGLTAEERVEFFRQLEEIFCSHCGYEQPKNMICCPCENDE